jgi:membrane protein
MAADSTVDQHLEPRQRVWDFVSRFPLHSLLNLQGISPRVVAIRTWKALFAANLG